MKKLLCLLALSCALAGAETPNPEVTVVTVRGQTTAPPLSLTNFARFYFDTATGQMKISQSGAAYSNMIVASPSFNNITGGTNTSADMVVGSGSHLEVNGTGDIGNLTSGTGVRNTSIGKNSGKAITSGTDNTFVGESAGRVQTTAINNTFVGSSAGTSVVTGGSNNTFIGNISGQLNTTGIHNTCVGSISGDSMAGATDQDNTCVGYNSGNSLNGSAQGANTFIGSGSGADVTTGYWNLCAGFNAGAAILTTGTSNTCLGYNTDTKNAATTGAIAIGAGSKADNAQFVAGSTNDPTTDVYFNKGVSDSIPGNFTIHGTGSSANGTNGANITLAGGLANQAADTGGAIAHKTARSGAGTTLVDRLTIGADGGVQWTGIATTNAPALSGANNGTIYYDSTAQSFYGSANGGAYAALGGSSGGFPVSSTSGTPQVILTSASTTVTGAGNTIAGGSGTLAATLTSGTNNVLIGASVDVGSATDTLDVCIGKSAVSPTGGTVIGANAGKASTTAARFTALGQKSGNAITSGADNCFCGYQSGLLEATGLQNAFFGSNSAIAATGNSGCAFGYNSAASLVGGASNVVIGNNADVGAGSAANTVAIGASAVAPTGGTVIGSGAGSGSATQARLTAVGNAAAHAITTTGADCTFLGDSAGTAVTTGGQNTFGGSAAGKAVVTTSDVTAFGYKAGTADTAASCCFFGSQAGQASVAGTHNFYGGYQSGNIAAGANDSDNTFLGYQAGLIANGSASGSNTLVGSLTNMGAATAVNATCIGEGAICPTSGIMIGQGSGKSGITAARLVCVGNISGTALTSGADNSFYGYNSGAATITGARNTYIGSQQALSETGSDNTMVGYVGMISATSGNKNTFVGSGIGTSTTLTTGGSNIFLGYQPDTSTSGTTGAIIMGISAVGGSNDFVAGSNTQAVSNVYFGKGKTAASSTAGSDWTLNGHGGGDTTNNQAGGNVNVAGGKGTGSAEPGLIQLQYGLKGASGTTLQSLSTQKYVLGGTLGTTTAATTVSAATVNTTETTLIGSLKGSQSLEGGLLRAGRTIDVKLKGTFIASLTPPTATFKVKIGTVVIGNSGAITFPNVSGSYFEIDATLTCQAVGASGTVYCTGKTLFDSAGIGAAADVAVLDGTATVDTTATANVDATITYSGNTAGNSVTINSLEIVSGN